MKKIFLLLFILASNFTFSQKDSIPNFDEDDLKYREDQFYFLVTYNILQNRPLGVTQNSFSVGLSTGFLRDFPINQKRTFAIAPGIGFSYNNYKQNMIIDDSSGTLLYSTIPANMTYDRNKFATYSIDVPLELRWRNSTPQSHKFYRIYSGFKFSYILFNESKYVDNTKAITVSNIPDLNKLQYGVYLTAGYNSWNIYAYYGFSKLFNKNFDGTNQGFNTLNVGLMFYIL
ncbi:MAG: porin family protein [Limnohabitans sp.]|nr:porin family protein [Limnohabitans sp.]